MGPEGTVTPAVAEATTTHLPVASTPGQYNTMHQITIHISILLKGAHVLFFSFKKELFSYLMYFYRNINLSTPL